MGKERFSRPDNDNRKEGGSFWGHNRAAFFSACPVLAGQSFFFVCDFSLCFYSLFGLSMSTPFRRRAPSAMLSSAPRVRWSVEIKN